jgi:hypothetical protein
MFQHQSFQSAAAKDWRECAKRLNALFELGYSGRSSSSLGSSRDGGGDKALPVLELAAAIW